MPIFIKNNGQPHLPDERRRPFFLPGWPESIAVGDRLEVSDRMLRTMLRPEGEESARDFADFVAATFNANRDAEWLSVIVDPGDPDDPAAGDEPAPPTIDNAPAPDPEPAPEQDPAPTEPAA